MKIAEATRIQELLMLTPEERAQVAIRAKELTEEYGLAARR